MKQTSKLFDAIYRLIPFIFYVAFAVIDGPSTFNDSNSYIQMSSIREPFYPCFLALIRFICQNKDFYLHIAVIIQSIIMACAVYSLCNYIRKEYKLNNIYSSLILLIYLGISIFNRFIAGRSAMYCTSIMSESIAIPMFLLFVRHSLEFLINDNDKNICLMSLLSLVMISTRKQMYLSVILIVVMLIYKLMTKKECKKYLVKVILSVLLICGVARLYDYCYINLTFSSGDSHTSDNRFLTTMIFYTSEREYGDLIKDEEVKQLFLEVYDICYENNYLKNSSNGKWFKRFQHFSDNYDRVQIDTLWPIMREHASALSKNELEMESLIDDYNSVINSSLLKVCIPSIMGTFVDNYFAGLMITISAERGIFAGYALIMYLAYILLLIYNVKKEGMNKYTILALLTTISVSFNVGIVSLLIFNQTRYTIYNMGLFYVSLLLLAINTYEIRRRGK